MNAGTDAGASATGNAGAGTEPIVRLVNCFDRPLDNAVAAARTCYAARGIVTPDQVAGDALDPDRATRRRQRRDALAADIYRAGHHTTFQHTHLQFTLDRVSRQFVWSFLHAHPFYNSEQVSQRYVEVEPDAIYVPPLTGRLRDGYLALTRRQMDDYRKLDELLRPAVTAEYLRIFPARARDLERWQGTIQRKSLEVARYLLPVATLTRLYHTISAITLLRYYRLALQFDAPHEQRLVVSRMVEELVRHDPDYAALLEEPLPLEETLEYRCFEAMRPDATGLETTASDAADHHTQPYVAEFQTEFDAELGGRVSRLVARKTDNEEILAAAVREVLGQPRSRLTDDEAIALVLDPAHNRYQGEALNLMSLSKLGRCLVHPGYTFRKRLSHTADSQDQRHRLTPASRPCLTAYLGRDPDVVTPALVMAERPARELYARSMQRSWEAIDTLRRQGLAEEFAAYLLPNAVALRFTQSADLAGLKHKLAMRLCYNAQEEIWRASLDEATQIAEVEPRIGRYLLPPCTLRRFAKIGPTCPEGKRYCGVRVWALDREEYERLI